MKKILFLITCLMLEINSVNALTLNEDGSYMNSKGANISANQYEVLLSKFSASKIDKLSQKAITLFSNADVIIETETKYTITTDTIQDGEVIDTITIETTEEQAKEISKNRNLHVMYDKKIHDVSKMIVPYYEPEGGHDQFYQTSSKKLSISYALFEGEIYPLALMDVEWFTIPMIKKYDILAFRWETSMPTSNVIEYFGTQTCEDKNGNVLQANYNLNSENLKIVSNGIGQIMNLFNDAANNLELNLEVYFKKAPGKVMYGSYQHARNSNITLTQAKSYSIKSGGLGNVVDFSNSTVRNYYDGMKGLQVINNYI